MENNFDDLDTFEILEEPSEPSITEIEVLQDIHAQLNIMSVLIFGLLLWAFIRRRD